MSFFWYPNGLLIWLMIGIVHLSILIYVNIHFFFPMDNGTPKSVLVLNTTFFWFATWLALGWFVGNPLLFGLYLSVRSPDRSGGYWLWGWVIGCTIAGLYISLKTIWQRLNPRPFPAAFTKHQVREIDLFPQSKEVAPSFFSHFNDLYNLQLVEIEVTLPDLPPAFDGFTVAQLSDLHYGDYLKPGFLEGAIETVNAASPDIIVFTGDFISFSRFIPDCANIVAAAQAPYGVFGITGNHDYWAGVGKVNAALTAKGIKLLRNQSVALTKADQKFYLVGVDDPYLRKDDYAKATNNVPSDAPRLVLAHAPDFAPLLARQLAETSPTLTGVLQLSGHTHGGQIVFPLIGPIIVPSRYGRRFASGPFQVGPVLLYVNRGLGGYPAFRLNCPPEITLFTLRCPQ